MNLRLPKYIFEKNVYSFLSILSRVGAEDRICLDFQQVKHYIPTTITLLVASIRQWQIEGREVQLINHRHNEAFRYLQRIDFFTALGLDYEEDFQRHAPLGAKRRGQTQNIKILWPNVNSSIATTLI